MRNKFLAKQLVWAMTLIMIITSLGVPAMAFGTDSVQSYGKKVQSYDKKVQSSDKAVQSTDKQAQAATVTGTFPKQAGQDVATIRYYTNPEKTIYKFAAVTETDSGYSYSFDAPYSGFSKVEGTSKEDENATVIAEYYSLTKWDGAVDVSWYDKAGANSKSYDINNPAQLAGFAAVVNGSINNKTPIYRVKGKRTDLSKSFNYDTPQTSKKQNMNEGLPDCIKNKYYEKTNLIAGVEDEAFEGLPANDFSNKTVNILADMDMGGADLSIDPSAIDHSKNAEKNAYDGVYPNWTPIGGAYLMDPSDSSTMIKASFNGTINGCGHHIRNLYCYRWSYRSVGDTAFGYAQGTGLVGMMGSLYDGEEQPSVCPGLKNMSLSGYIYGRRMVGGFVGCMGGGSNAASGTSVEGGIMLENLANHADVHCTDSKGLGGIVACSMIDAGDIINCYNTGNMDADFAAPTGGIVGSNEGMNIYCCYNTGKLNTHGNSRGRAIGYDNGGSKYTVNDCYYLEGTGDDSKYPGYYTANLAKSVKVTTTSLKEKEITDGTLLNKLNVNGTAYTVGANGYPVLFWEKNSPSGKGSLTLTQPQEGGSISASEKEGALENGSIVYLSSEAEDGWKCKSFSLNGQKVTGKYVTVNGICTVTGNFEIAKAGMIKIINSDVCDITVTKNGIIKEGDKTITVTDYPVKTGDALYEGDVLIVDAELKTVGGKPVTPENKDLIYKASMPDFFSQQYRFTYTYMDGDDSPVEEPSETSMPTYTVGSQIGEDDISLTLNTEALTAQKMWDYAADTSWYNDDKDSFTINTASELAGLSVLVDRGNSFEGKTIRLGNDISLKNNDGTSGMRFWDGIGDSQGTGFAGIFDGQGHKIKDYNGNKNGLFEYCEGKSETDKAVVKNLELWGKSSGSNACGFVMQAKNTKIENCSSYCIIDGASEAASKVSASILGYGKNGCAIEKCRNYAEVSGKGTVGGIVGELSSNDEVKDCINKGNVFARSENGNNVGGISGNLSGMLKSSSNYGNIEAWGRNIGGIAGISASSSAGIDSCSNFGTVCFDKGTNTYDSIGGIIGFGSLYKISNSFNYGKIDIAGGDISSGNTGAVVGREMKNSKSNTEDVYYLDTSCKYAEAGMTQEELPKTTYAGGIKKADAASFASSTGVIKAINDSSVFKLTEGKYPELDMTGVHIHEGGKSTCAELAICSECGLAYGAYDTKHGGTKTVGKKDAVWNIDGYTGDICCKECGKVIEKGSVIKADTSRKAIDFAVKKGSRTISSSSYTVAEFDRLKENKAIGYSYGGDSAELVAATQYVTLDKLLEKSGLTVDDIESVDVECTDTKSNISSDTLKACSRFYENNISYDAPAAFAIAWNTGKGTLAQVAAESAVNGTIRFGYGISEEQYKNKESLGGRRLISPVTSVTVNLADIKVEYNGEKKYMTDAISEANEKGGTIKLISNADTGDEGFVIDSLSDVTLDLNGWELLSTNNPCITVKKGNLNIVDSSTSGNGRVAGTLSAVQDSSISAEAGTYTYELEEAYCKAGYVPELIGDNEYKLVKRTAYEAAANLNSIKKQIESLQAECNLLTAKIKLNTTAVTVKATPISYNSIKVTWKADSDISIFKLQKWVKDQWMDISDVTGNEYTDEAEPGIVNRYRVAAGTEYEGIRSKELVYGKYTEATVSTTLAIAVIKKLTSKNKKLYCTWGPVAGSTSYDMFIGTDAAVTKGLVKYQNVKTTSLTSKTLKKKKIYYVKVRAKVVNSEGKIVYGSWSASKKITNK